MDPLIYFGPQNNPESNNGGGAADPNPEPLQQENGEVVDLKRQIYCLEKTLAETVSKKLIKPIKWIQSKL